MAEVSDMTLEDELKDIGVRYEAVLEKKYGKAYYVADKRTLVCVLTEEYVPIEKFKKFFLAMGEIVAKKEVEKLVFDKRHLRTFHQPSMEWYFVDWKQDMLHYGLNRHRKLLPEGLPWFKQAVMAGRKQIMENRSDLPFDKIDISYSNSIKEAIDN